MAVKVKCIFFILFINAPVKASLWLTAKYYFSLSPFASTLQLYKCNWMFPIDDNFPSIFYPMAVKVKCTSDFINQCAPFILFIICQHCLG